MGSACCKQQKTEETQSLLDGANKDADSSSKGSEEEAHGVQGGFTNEHGDEDSNCTKENRGMGSEAQVDNVLTVVQVNQEVGSEVPNLETDEKKCPEDSFPKIEDGHTPDHNQEINLMYVEDEETGSAHVLYPVPKIETIHVEDPPKLEYLQVEPTAKRSESELSSSAKFEDVRRIGLSLKSESIKEADPSLKNETVAAAVPYLERETVEAVDPFFKKETLAAVDPSFKKETVEAVNPFFKKETVAAVDPSLQKETIETVDPLFKKETVDAVDPSLKNEIAEAVDNLFMYESTEGADPEPTEVVMPSLTIEKIVEVEPSLTTETVEVDDVEPSLTTETVEVDDVEPSLTTETVEVDEVEPSHTTETVEVDEVEPSLTPETVEVDEVEPSLTPETVEVDEVEPSLTTETEEVVEPSLKKETVEAVGALFEYESIEDADRFIKNEPTEIVDSSLENEPTEVADSLFENETVEAVDPSLKNEAIEAVDSLLEKETVEAVDSLLEKETVEAVDSLLENETVEAVDSLLENDPTEAVDSLLENDPREVGDSLLENETAEAVDPSLESETVEAVDTSFNYEPPEDADPEATVAVLPPFTMETVEVGEPSLTIETVEVVEPSLTMETVEVGEPTLKSPSLQSEEPLPGTQDMKADYSTPKSVDGLVGSNAVFPDEASPPTDHEPCMENLSRPAHEDATELVLSSDGESEDEEQTREVDVPAAVGETSDVNDDIHGIMSPNQATEPSLMDELVPRESIEDLYCAEQEIVQLEKTEPLLQITPPGVQDRSSVAPGVDILAYCQREWKGNTATSAIIRKGYSVLSQSFEGLQRVRGDNYCALRATLYQILCHSDKLPAWIEDDDITLLPENLAAEIELVGGWKFPLGHEAGGNKGPVEQLKRHLNLLQKTWREAAEAGDAEERQRLCDALFRGGEEEHALLEAVKLLMLSSAVELYQRMGRDEEVPVFCWLLFARDDSESPGAFLANHLSHVGFSGGLEQVEMFLLGYALQHTIQAYRLYKTDTEEFITYYPDDHNGAWPQVCLVTEDDRHYNVLVEKLKGNDLPEDPTVAE
ncbi:hypothetical protein COCON_G00065320 [Conger conger]|uniref:OTU domain-containing protein n=1 Tax=Conger conger TaxID=82655 RepID=A0A9Q1DS88_CONCO|nr:hypothetical protein COCON_G00065320 [Conger conger]